MRRAIQNNWDPVEQFSDRVSMLAECGHVLDKFEVKKRLSTRSFQLYMQPPCHCAGVGAHHFVFFLDIGDSADERKKG